MEIEAAVPNGVGGEGLIPTENRDDIPQINPAIGAPTVVPPTIVREVLIEGNYANWITCVQQYLVGQDLWEVCQIRCEAPDKALHPGAYSEWERKNAMALHAIQISCSQTMLSRIRGIELANQAWNFLAQNANPTRYSDQILHHKRLPLATASTEEPDFSRYEELRKALEKGSWIDIEDFLKTHPGAVRAKLGAGVTPLHAAAALGHVKVVEKLVEILNEEDLELKDDEFGHTPLLAALEGDRCVIDIAKAMITRNSRLPNIANANNILPVQIACNKYRREMTRFLYMNTAPEQLDPNKGPNGALLLVACISAEFLDIALDIVQKDPRLALTVDTGDNLPLHLLGQMPFLFKSGSQLRFWQRWIYSCITANIDPASDRVQLNIVDDTSYWQDKTNNTSTGLQFLHRLVSYPLELLGIKNIYLQKLMHAQTTKLLQVSIAELKKLIGNDNLRLRVHHAVIQAVNTGNVEYAITMVKNIPQLVWDMDINGRNIFCSAILNRQERIFDLFHGLSNERKMKAVFLYDVFRNNMLHLAAMLPPLTQLNNSSGAALQMQRELQWYKEVESIVPPTCKKFLNSNGKKPSEVFSEQHAGLVKEGEKWMKGIAKSSTFVAALIVTMTFAAAFTIPGGNNGEVTPILLDNNFFMVFIVSDSISLLSATTSVLMFLVILTSQYEEEKFLWQLPTKLIIGLSSLFISIAAMLIAFCSALAIVVKESSTYVITPIVLLASIPVTLFSVMQIPLLAKIFNSTYGPSIFNRKIEQWY